MTRDTVIELPEAAAEAQRQYMQDELNRSFEARERRRQTKRSFFWVNTRNRDSRAS